MINLFIQAFGYKSYLEIGVSNGENFILIRCDMKEGVDPTKNFDGLQYQMTSDEFFKKHSDKKYDVIFIDGHHDAEYVQRDINNALKQLNPNGTIFVHDCLPPMKETAVKFHELTASQWCGDGFKVIRSIVKNYSDRLECAVVNSDWGVGIIRKKNPTVEVTVEYDESYSWETMMSERKTALNVITPQQLIAMTKRV